jgi:hypothetical protein
MPPAKVTTEISTYSLKANLSQRPRLAAESIARAPARFELGYGSAGSAPPRDFFTLDYMQ